MFLDEEPPSAPGTLRRRFCELLVLIQSALGSILSLSPGPDGASGWTLP